MPAGRRRKEAVLASRLTNRVRLDRVANHERSSFVGANHCHCHARKTWTPPFAGERDFDGEAEGHKLTFASATRIRIDKSSGAARAPRPADLTDGV